MIESRDLPPLPEGWVLTKVINLKGLSGVIKDGDWILSEDLKTGNEVRLIQLADVGQGYFLDRSNKFISKKRALELNCTFLKAGDILISRMAYPIARACILPHIQYDSITAVDVTILRPDLEFFDKNFICWLFNSELIRKQAEQLSSGTTRKRISRKNLETLDIPLPPLPEQHRIIAKIEELFIKLDAGIKSLKTINAQLKHYRQAVLKHAFEGKLTEEWREVHKDEIESASVLLERIKEERKKNAKGKYKELPPRDTSDLPELPEGWVWTKLDIISSKITDGEHIRPKVTAKGIPFLSAKDVRDVGVVFNDLLYIAEEDAIKFRQRCNPDLGDILIVSRGATVGRSCIVNTEKKICLLGSVILIKLYQEILNKFISYTIKSSNIQRQLINISGSTAQQAIYLRDIKKISIAIPPLVEQHKIVEEIERRFSVADEVGRTVEHSLKQSERLRQSILKGAFKGKLVPQDPTDEPASILLERIKEKRKNREIEGKSKSKIKQTRFNDYV